MIYSELRLLELGEGEFFFLYEAEGSGKRGEAIDDLFVILFMINLCHSCVYCNTGGLGFQVI